MFGTLLRFFRERAELSQEALGLKVGFSKSQVAMVERGQRPPKGEFIARADEVLGAQGALLAAGAELRPSHLASWFEEFASVETGASARHEYETHAVPGLLQTEEHARAVFTNHHPSLDDEEIEGRVLARLERQKLLTRRPAADIGFVLELHPLTRPIGGRQVRKRQLRHILDVALHETDRRGGRGRMSTDLNWFKSSYSGDQGGDCVEVALAWSKSSYSGDQGGNCIEVAACPHTVHVRDSKDVAVPALTLSPAAWTAFLGYAGEGHA